MAADSKGRTPRDEALARGLDAIVGLLDRAIQTRAGAGEAMTEPRMESKDRTAAAP